MNERHENFLGQLLFKTLGFPLKYLYYISTFIITTQVDKDPNSKLIWSTRLTNKKNELYYKIESKDTLRLYTKAGVGDEARDLRPFKGGFFFDSKYSVKYGCASPVVL